LEANSDSENSPIIAALEAIPREILGMIGTIYPKLAEEVPEAPVKALDLPPVEQLIDRVAKTSFKVFDNDASYVESERAKSYPSWSGSKAQPIRNSDVYRVFFNDYSKKIYVDLNGVRWDEVRKNLEEERLYCEILRTLIFVHTCEVEKNEETVSSGASEIIVT